MRLKEKINFNKLSLAVGAMAIERVAGLFTLKLSLFFPLVGALNIAKNGKIDRITIPILLVCILSIVSGFGHQYELAQFVRSVQLVLTVFAFNAIILNMDSITLEKAFLYLFPIMGAVFLFELTVKPDLLEAYLSADLNYFINSGGTKFEDGLQLIAQGNVYAAALAGACGIVCLFSRHKIPAIFYFFLAASTGSRALAVAAFAIFLVIIAFKFTKKTGAFSVYSFVIILGLQPLIYLNMELLFSESINEYLYSLSPRYVAFIAYANMGLDNFLGVGYFQGQYHTDYFFARWPIPAHNVFMSVFGELGPIAYIFWLFFFIGIARIVSNSLKASVLFVFTLCLYTFIGGFNEWSFWVPIAMSILWARDGIENTRDSGCSASNCNL